MSDRIKVLVVDDHPANIKLFSRGLSREFDVDTADNGALALQKLSTEDYDIVLLDVSMPILDGYQVCETLRVTTRNATIPVIFVSAMTSLEDKLKGYAAGGNDYIEKPVVFEELTQKITLSVSHSRKINVLDNQVKLATETAMTAMTNSNELGIIVNFVESSFQAENSEALQRALLNSISQYQVCACIQFRQKNQVVNTCSSGLQISRLEVDLLTRGYNADRIITLGQRGFFNSKRVSILIRNLPTNDEGKYGRLVDHIAAIVVAADARCKQLELQEKRLESRDEALDNIADIADEEIESIQIKFSHFRLEASRIMSELHSDVEESLLDITLSNEQEDRLYRLLEQGKQEMEELLDLGLMVQDSLAKIKSTVTGTIKKMD